MLMEVVKRVRVRKEPRVAEETMVEWLETGSQFEVVADVVQEAENYIWRQHADTGYWSAESHVKGTLYLLEVIQPYMATDTSAPETVPMKALAAANIRSDATTSAADVGDVAVGDVVEVFPGERVIADDYVWVRHSDNRWSVQVKISSGTVYLERVPQPGVLAVDTTTLRSSKSVQIDETVVEEEKVETTLLMDVVQQVEGRSEPRLSPDNVIDTLQPGAQVAVKIDVSKNVDGFTWRQGADNGQWYAEKADEGGIFLLEVIQPDTEASETAKMKVTTGLNIRSEPSGDAADVGDLKAGQFIDVYPKERFIGPGYAWLRHGVNQWSAQVRYSDGEVYLERVEQSLLTEILESGIADAGEYGVGFRSLFQQLPVSLANTQWFYYYGNTVIAYKCRDIYGYGYARGLHGGLDFGNKTSAIVVAGVNGVVSKIEAKDPYNGKVWVKTDNYLIIYQHIWNEKVGVGQVVGPDTPVAEVKPAKIPGTTTSNQGLDHLHLEVRDSGSTKILNPLMMMPASMSSSLIDKYPAEKAAAFLTRFGQYLEPLDQPVIPISSSNYDNPMVPNGFLSQAELDAIPYGC